MADNGLPDDRAVAKAIAHPLRLEILDTLDGCTVSPTELAIALDAKLGTVSYHVRQLHALGFLELVKEVPRRGAVEHFYTARVRLAVTFTMEEIGGEPERIVCPDCRERLGEEHKCDRPGKVRLAETVRA